MYFYESVSECTNKTNYFLKDKVELKWTEVSCWECVIPFCSASRPILHARKNWTTPLASNIRIRTKQHDCVIQCVHDKPDDQSVSSKVEDCDMNWAEDNGNTEPTLIAEHDDL